MPSTKAIREVVLEDREKQIPGYRWHLQDLWRGDLRRVAWLSQCYMVWHYFISIHYKVGKVKPLKKMIIQGKSNLLAPLGKQRLSKQDDEKILSFMQTIMYSGKQDEDFVEQESTCTNSRKTSPASLYYPTNTVQKSTLNSQTSKLTFENNVSLKTLTILTQRNVDGK